MPTHAQLCVTLLKDAALFFRNMAETNASLKTQMNSNAAVFEQMAKAMELQPTAMAGNATYAMMAAEMLKNAAQFFRSIAAENEPIREQLERSADIYEQMARHVAEDPLGVMD